MSTTRSTASARRAAPAERPEQPVGDPERGTGLVGALVGFTVFLLLLLFGVQVLLRLYATSMLTSAAVRAAEAVASAPGDQAAAAARAEQEARRELGTFGATRVTFAWKEVDGQQVVLQVRGRAPGFVPLLVSSQTIVRTVTVRTERFR